jgi:hypothetical protein
VAVVLGSMLVAGAAGGANLPGAYTGSATALVLTAAEAKYEKREGLKPSRPTIGKRRGFRSGVDVSYSDAGSPIADVTIFVYDTAESALAAYRDACPPCKPVRSVKLSGARLKATNFSQTQDGIPIVCAGVPAVRHTVYVAITTCAQKAYTHAKLRFDAGYLIGSIFGKAAAGGVKSRAACHPAYSGCLPVRADIDCADISESKKPLRIKGADPYRLDRDGDGIGCEPSDR